MIGNFLDQLQIPTPIVDPRIVKENVNRMKEKISSFGASFRPHFKTHQSGLVGNLARECGVNKIAVSSVSMAYYFAKNGWKDMTLAIPFNIRELPQLVSLAAKVDTMNIMIDQVFTAQYVTDHLKDVKVGVFFKIDTGYHRCGIEAHEYDTFEKMLSIISKNEHLVFKGFLTHCGHTYTKSTTEQRKDILDQARLDMIELRNKYKATYPDIIISIGDTPGISAAKNLEGIDEVRPGNYIFYDVMQLRMGNCKAENISITVACPIISCHPERNQVVVYGGGTHLSKEYLLAPDGSKICGYVVSYNQDGTWTYIPDALVTTLSQEHGIITFQTKEGFEKFKTGDVIGMLPVHSCMTSCVSKTWFTTDGTKFTSLLYENEDYPQ